MNYYSQGNAAVNINPYQQNIDIIKSFFKKPIVFVFALISLINSVISLIGNFFPNVSSYVNFYTYSGQVYNTTSANILSILINSIISIYFTFFAVCWLIVNITSKSSNPQKSPFGAIKALWVLSIIFLVFSCLISFILLLGVLVLLSFIFIDPSSMGTVAYQLELINLMKHREEMIAVLFIFIFVIIFLMIYSISQLLFFSSVKKSLNSIYLKKTGAGLFGIVNIIYAVFAAFAALAIFIINVMTNITFPVFTYNTINIYLSVLNSILSFLTYLLSGIIAINYSSYIKRVIMGTNQQFNANIPYSNPVAPSNTPYPQQQSMYNNSYDNIQNQNPYATPQQINPQEPQEPVSVPDNQYYQPVESSAPQNAASVQEENFANSNVCPNCGSHVFRSDMFCNNCGTKLK